MDDIKKPYAEGARNLEKIIQQITDQQQVEIKAKIIPFFEHGERYYLVECEPQLPLEIEADTEEEAHQKFEATLKFLFNNEAKDRNVEIDFSFITIVYDPPIRY